MQAGKSRRIEEAIGRQMQRFLGDEKGGGGGGDFLGEKQRWVGSKRWLRDHDPP